MELFLGRSWRLHDDTDVEILRGDVSQVAELIGDWDLHVAANGELTPWDGSEPSAEQDQNNLWCRRAPEAPWCLDITISDGDSSRWIYRRDPKVSLEWSAAVLTSPDGVDFLAPEIQLLFKSKNVRTKDSIDAHEVIPGLDLERRNWLTGHLSPAHPWQELLH